MSNIKATKLITNPKMLVGQMAITFVTIVALRTVGKRFYAKLNELLDNGI